MAQTIVITCRPGGDIQVEAQGFTGAGCTKATQKATDALLGGVNSRELKPEYNRTVPPTRLKETE